LGFPADAVTIDGASLANFESSPDVLRSHCSRCGTSLSYRRTGRAGQADPLIHLTVSSCNEQDQLPPVEIVYYDERPSWFRLPPDLPQHSGRSPEYGTRADARPKT